MILSYASFYAFTLLGDAIYANPLLLGYVWQKGKVPLRLEMIQRAIELNGVTVEKNLDAFYWGRYLAHFGNDSLKTQGIQEEKTVSFTENTSALLKRLSSYLTDYQNAAYADKFLKAIEPIKATEEKVLGTGHHALTDAAAKNLAKVMAYKDEYEVARLYTRPEYMEQLRKTFAGEPGKDYEILVHMAPPTFSKKKADGHLQKKAYGPWVFNAFKLLTKMKGLRGTGLDIFGKTEERRAERALIQDYMDLLTTLENKLSTDNIDVAIALAELPDEVRGYGHVKEKNLKKYYAKKAELLQKLNA